LTNNTATILEQKQQKIQTDLTNEEFDGILSKFCKKFAIKKRELLEALSFEFKL